MNQVEPNSDSNSADDSSGDSPASVASDENVQARDQAVLPEANVSELSSPADANQGDVTKEEAGDIEEKTVSAEKAAPAPPPPAAKPKVDKSTGTDTVRPIKLDGSPMTSDDVAQMDWYILKVAFNREDSIADALRKRVKMEGMGEFFGDIIVPTEDVATFTRDGKRRVTKRKLLPGYIMVNMLINDDTWFLCRETGGISDFTGAAGKPMPMEPSDIDRFVNRPEVDEEEETPIKIGIPFRVGDRVRVKEGNFENQEGEVDTVDEANGRVTVIINIFGRSVPMELDHWQVEPL